jgi:hypothetical protein
MTPVFKSKILTYRTKNFNSFHLATVVYSNSTEINGSGSNEPSYKDTEYTGASESENEFERVRHAELDSLLDKRFPSAQPPTPSNPVVEEWLEGLEKEGVDVRTGEGYTSESGEETQQPSQELEKGQEQEQEQMDVDSEGGSDSDYSDFFDFILKQSQKIITQKQCFI